MKEFDMQILRTVSRLFQYDPYRRSEKCRCTSIAVFLQSHTFFHCFIILRISQKESGKERMIGRLAICECTIFLRSLLFLCTEFKVLRFMHNAGRAGDQRGRTTVFKLINSLTFVIIGLLYARPLLYVLIHCRSAKWG